MSTHILDCDGFAARLADYLEGDAPAGVRAAVDEHASACPGCAALLADLDALRQDAAALPPLEPSRDLWAGIAERIDATVVRPMEAPRAIRTMPRRTWVRPTVAAAALVLVTAGITHVLTRARYQPAPTPRVAVVPDTPATPSAPSGTNGQLVAEPAPAATPSSAPASRLASAGPSPRRVAAPAGDRAEARLVAAERIMQRDVEPMYDREIAKLRRVVRDRRSQLDPRTVAVLEQSIAVIDTAIAQSRAALAKDPASGFLATQLNHSLEKKVELLRTAAMLPART